MIASQLKTLIRRSPALERMARLIVDRRYQLARRHLRGIGLEIGALDRPLLLPSQAKAYYLDHLLPSQLRKHYPELAARKFFVSLVADGEDMACIQNDSLDFIIANHVIEHCEDPIATLKTFRSKLCSQGIVFMAVPDMRRTFDHNRVETSWEHLQADHEQGPAQSRRQHFREWVTVVEGLSGEAAETRLASLFDMHYSIHFHCWTETGLRAFLQRMKDYAPLNLIESASWKNENIVILQKCD